MLTGFAVRDDRPRAVLARDCRRVVQNEAVQTFKLDGYAMVHPDCLTPLHDGTVSDSWDLTLTWGGDWR